MKKTKNKREMKEVLSRLYCLAPELLIQGLNRTQIGILLVLKEYELRHKDCTSEDLRKSFWEELTSSKLHSTMKALLDKGYVNRELAESNKTLRRLELTSSGKQVIGEILKEWKVFTEECFDGLSIQEQSILLKILDKIKQVFEKRIENES